MLREFIKMMKEDFEFRCMTIFAIIALTYINVGLLIPNKEIGCVIEMWGFIVGPACMLIAEEIIDAHDMKPKKIRSQKSGTLHGFLLLRFHLKFANFTRVIIGEERLQNLNPGRKTINFRRNLL